MSKTETLLAGRQCLVLEDEFLIALDLQDILEQAGASVRCLSKAGDALAVLDAGEIRFDVAVLDVHLGAASLTSLSVAAALTARGIPFVFLTGLRRDSPQTAAYPNVPVLEKPYQQAVLLETVRGLVS